MLENRAIIAPKTIGDIRCDIFTDIFIIYFIEIK